MNCAGAGCALKLAVTVVSEPMVTVQEPVPLGLQVGSVQPAKLELGPAAAVRVTVLPLAKGAVQVGPQLMPPGLLATTPVPPPVLCTVSWKLGGGGGGSALKVAVTEVSAVKETVQEPVPEQAPDQPAKVKEELGAAVSVTAVPVGKAAAQVVPQLMPLGLLETVPLPAFWTVS
jgi:hypothetical protein